MMLFAAIRSTGDPRLDREHTTPVAAALGAIACERARTLTLDQCTLLAAPLAEGEAAQPYTDPVSGVSAVGEAVLEGRAALARRLDIDAALPALALAVAAYGRWGARCAEQLRGEYAFALWDPDRRMLLAARDGLGIRRLFVAEAPGATIVSNVLGAAMAYPAVPRTLDQGAVLSFLTDGAVEDGRTIYRAARPVPAGHALTVEAGGVRLARHWWFPLRRDDRQVRSAGILEEYRATLGEAVADRLGGGRVALLLSGGVDSTTIAAAACDAAPGLALRGFTARYARFSSIDEWPLARAAAGHLGFPAEEVAGDRHEALASCDIGPALSQPIDEPTLADWRALLAAAQQHSAVALYGEDGDALLLPGGWQSLVREQSWPGVLVQAAAYSLRERRLPYLGLRVRERLRGQAPTPSAPRWLTPEARAILGHAEPAGISGGRPEPLPPHPTRPAMQRRLGRPVSGFLADLIAPEITRQRIQLRLPLLDTRVLQVVVNAPSIPWCQAKRLPRLAYRGRLPDSILTRPKTGLAGFDAALVASWRHQSITVPDRLEAPLDAWIDAASWRDSLRQDGWPAIGTAWRVLQLAAWLRSIRHEAAACTA